MEALLTPMSDEFRMYTLYAAIAIGVVNGVVTAYLERRAELKAKNHR